ncbi:17298_t:CDS:2 [Gigaspora margarita]|uniref:17298_t:CDS:1 n=1 Tax=Gigaspora margarita TaxID=4874 RepID=A0ABN7WK01_GIGMA|nr:17298_t:CDS:2 [Gigaspora margarita]
MSASRNKMSYPESYTLLLKVYQEMNPTKKKDIAIREAQDLKKKERRLFFIKAAHQSQECNALKHIEEQAQASSTTIAEDTTEDITKNTTEDTTDMSKRREMPAQTKLKKELI